MQYFALKSLFDDESIYALLLKNEINNHFYADNRTIYFEPTLDESMVEALNIVFERLDCADVINFGKCFPNMQDSGRKEHITLEEMERGDTLSYKRMLKYMKNKSIEWPEDFKEPGYVWDHSYKQSITKRAFFLKRFLTQC